MSLAALPGLHVVSQVNIADDPSRGDYEILYIEGARRVPPKPDAAFLEPQAWESLSIADVCKLRRPVPS